MHDHLPAAESAPIAPTAMPAPAAPARRPAAISALAAALAGLLAQPAAAPAQSGTPAGPDGTTTATAPAKPPARARSHARPRLVFEARRVQPGQTVLLGIHFEIDDEWHIYWPGDNDSGSPTTVSLDLPKGVTAGPILWPAPSKHVGEGDIVDYIYERAVTLLIPLTIDPAYADDTLAVGAEVKWLECKEACIPGRRVMGVAIEVEPAAATGTAPAASPGSVPAPPAADALGPDAALFRVARARVPVPATPGSVSTTWSGEELSIGVEGAASLAFYPLEGCARLENPAGDGAAQGATLLLRFEPTPPAAPIKGVLEVRRGDGAAPMFLSIDLARPLPGVAPGQTGGKPGVP